MRRAFLLNLAEDASGDSFWHLPIHGSECEADAVPAEISEASVRLKIRVRADVLFQKLSATVKAELSRDAADFPDAGIFSERLHHLSHSLIVHEHDAVHELNVFSLAGGDDLKDIARGDADWFLNENMFACLCRADDPLLPDASGEWKIDRIHLGVGDQFFIASECLWHLRVWDGSLAFGDEGCALRCITAGDGDEAGIASIEDGLPVLPRNVGGSENAPSAFSSSVHELFDDKFSLAGVHFILPGFEPRFEVFDDFGMLPGQAAAFTNICVEIVEKIHGVAVIEILPFAMPDGPLFAIGAVDSPEKRALTLRCFGRENRQEVHAIGLVVPGCFGTCGGDEGGREIHGDGHLLGGLSFRQLRRPAHHARHMNAAFPKGGFVMKERPVIG